MIDVLQHRPTKNGTDERIIVVVAAVAESKDLREGRRSRCPTKRRLVAVVVVIIIRIIMMMTINSKLSGGQSGSS
jgi:hypothetical protein